MVTLDPGWITGWPGSWLGEAWSEDWSVRRAGIRAGIREGTRGTVGKVMGAVAGVGNGRGSRARLGPKCWVESIAERVDEGPVSASCSREPKDITAERAGILGKEEKDGVGEPDRNMSAGGLVVGFLVDVDGVVGVALIDIDGEGGGVARGGVGGGVG